MCMYAIGIPRTLSVMFCPCESDVVKLIKLNYWPATPTRPSIMSLFILPVGLAGGSAPWVSSGTTWCYWSYSFSDQREDGVCMCTACSYIISCQICGLFIVMSCQLYTLFIALNIDALQVIPCPDWCLWRVPVSILILIMLLVGMKFTTIFVGAQVHERANPLTWVCFLCV